MSQKSEDLIYITVEAWNIAYSASAVEDKHPSIPAP